MVLYISMGRKQICLIYSTQTRPFLDNVEHGSCVLFAVFFYICLPAYLAHTHLSPYFTIIFSDIVLLLMSDSPLPNLEKLAFPKLFSGTLD